MNLLARLQTWSLVVGFSVVALTGTVAASRRPSPTLPKDPCALLKPDEIQAAIAAKSTVGAGVATTSTAPLAVSCSYTWGPRTSEWGESSVTVTVFDASKAWPGLSPDQIQAALLAAARDHKSEASKITGVGEGGVFTVNASNHNATAETHLAAKALHLSVEFHGGNLSSSKDKVTGLLKQAAGRL